MKLALFCQFLVLFIGITLAGSSQALQPALKRDPPWFPLTADDVHDPTVAELGLLQNPEEALSRLPSDGAGNHVNWVKALEKGYIKPIASLRVNATPEVLDKDVIWKDVGEMDFVLFPHKQHTEWMGCGDCHDAIFKAKAGADKFGMFDILNGEYCGRCHGAVAFPLTECRRCHSVPRPAVVIHAQPH